MSAPVVVVMPAYNEEACLREVVAEWMQTLETLPGAILLIVDDGSRDRTPQLLEELATEYSGRIRHLRQSNGGHGSAVLRGYREAVMLGPEWVFQTDSDRQIPAASFHTLWAQREQADFIQAVRSNRHDPKLRIWLSDAHRLLLKLVFGHAPIDPNVPFRLMRTSLLARLLTSLPPRPFAPNVFLSLLAQRGGAFLDSVPVPHRERTTGAVSIRGWKTLKIVIGCGWEILSFARNEFRQFGRASG